MVGQTLGPYHVVGKLGEGGMGEVYRARDTHLGRDVAIKVLPAAVAADPDRLARFDREARTLAALNHPNIATIHGLEKGDGATALVMELVEGPTLADRIAQGPIPIDEALPIARQIAEALEAAHEQGIVHRDLKPANVKVRADGAVKVLDFGLAKAIEPATGYGLQASAGLTNSPTITTPAMTQAGMILGTAAYMSPEQARGRLVDKRTDIWAFGVVLFEMLTGRPMLAGETVTDVLGAILHKDPEWVRLPSDTPDALRRLLRRCLTKNSRDRLRDIGDARLEIGAARSELTGGSPVSTGSAARWAQPRQVAAGLVGAFLLGVLAMAAVQLRNDGLAEQSGVDTPAAPLTATVVELPAHALLALGTHVPLHGFDSPVVALAPDGSHLAYVGQSGAGTMIYLREMAGEQIRPLAGTEGAIHPFFSPDGQSVGFLTNDHVRRVSLGTGEVSTLADATTPVQGWWIDDVIYFSHDEGTRLSRVPDSGSQRPTPVVEDLWQVLGSTGQAVKFSDVLPGGRNFLVTRWRTSVSANYAEVVLLDLQTRKVTSLISNGYGARYVGPGHLLFGRGGNLMAVRFELAAQETAGEPVRLAGASMESLFGQVHTAVSTNGLLVMIPGGDRSIGRLAWVDRNGEVEFLENAPPRIYGVVNLARDGRRLAVHVGDVSDYIWIYDVAQRAGRRLSGSESYGWPVWSPDGRQILFRALVPGATFVRSVDQGDAPREAIPPALVSPQSWMPDGKALVGSKETGQVGIASLDGNVQYIDVDGWPNGYSPDARWFAYTSFEGRGYSIWVASYPDGAVRRQISDRGIETVWCPCGELFYRDGNRWFATRMTASDPEPRFDPPRLAFETDYIDTPGISFDVSPDGQRLLVVKRAEPDEQRKLHVVTNWPQAVAR